MGVPTWRHGCPYPRDSGVPTPRDTSQCIDIGYIPIASLPVTLDHGTDGDEFLDGTVDRFDVASGPGRDEVA